jgi:hypothetical protein
MRVLMIGLIGILAAVIVGLTPDQRNDLECLGVSKTLAQGHRPVDPIARYFARRLKMVDPKRDWLSEAPVFNGNATYREFIAQLERCQERMRCLSSRKTADGGHEVCAPRP